MTVVIGKDNFADIKKEGLVLVDFWAEWCGPCQTMLPILDNFSEDMKGKVTVWKINVDENPEIAGEYRVMSIPTLILFKDWEMVDQMVWVKTIGELKEACDKYL